jgi:hypothetical protein
VMSGRILASSFASAALVNPMPASSWRTTVR